MSWSGTLRCSHCYSQGHNRRTCPVIIEQYLQSYKRADTENGRTHYAQELEKRGIDPKTGKKMTVAQRTKRGAGRAAMRCGYCREVGHTRRSCQNLKNDYEVYKHLSRQYRTEFLVALREVGVGVGSLMLHRQYGYIPLTREYGYQQMPSMIVGIRWEGVDAHARDEHVFATRYLLPDRHGALEALPRSLTYVKNLQSTGDVKTTCAERLDPPDGWVEYREVKPLKQVFDSKEPRAYMYNTTRDESVTAARAALGLPRLVGEDS